MEKFVPCGICNNGYVRIKTKSGFEGLARCQCRIQYEERIFEEMKLYEANIPKSIMGYSIDSYIGPDKNGNIPKLKKFVEQFKEKFLNKILYMHGDIGTQKTTLACWIGRELLKKGVSVKYTLMNKLMIDLQEERFDENTKIEPYYKCDCLIIDRAFDSKQLTLYKSGYQIPFIDTFLRHRIDMDQKCIIFVSNVPYTEISSHGFGYDIEDLIIRKVKPYNMALQFDDHYSLKEKITDLWEN